MLSTCSSPNRPPQRSPSHVMVLRPQTRPFRPCRGTASSQEPGRSTATASTRSLWLRSVTTDPLYTSLLIFGEVKIWNGMLFCSKKCAVHFNWFWFALQEVQQFNFHPVLICVTPCVCCAVSSAGAAAGEAPGDVQEDAGTVADGREVPPTHRPGAGHGETQTRRLHEQKRRLHKPPGAGEGEVRFIFGSSRFFCFLSLVVVLLSQLLWIQFCFWDNITSNLFHPMDRNVIIKWNTVCNVRPYQLASVWPCADRSCFILFR